MGIRLRTGVLAGLGLALWDHPLPQVLTWGRLTPGSRLAKGPALFPRIETEEK